jgi:hypothetical protein
VTFIERVMRRVGKDLDARVWGAEGAAHFRFNELKEDATLIVAARLSGGQGTVELDVQRPDGPPRVERAQDVVSTALRPAQDYRGGKITVDADVTGKDLAVLSVELTEPDPTGDDRAPLAHQTYSVEARLDEAGRAHLTLAIEL